MNSYDYVVIGAGPAGLAFASTINNPSVLVVDAGKPVDQRDRFNPQECIHGAGGAGLFSDGKFSFYPSGTHIWTYNPKWLRKGYEKLAQDLGVFKKIPDYPEINDKDKLEENKAGWFLKPYESIYLDLNDRIQLIKNLAIRCMNIQYQTEFTSFTPTNEGYNVELKDLQTGEIKSLHTRKIVWAGGRFMPLFLECAKVFRRYEFGFRVEGPSHLIQKEVTLIDPKYIYKRDGMEYRTFCWCDNGEVVQTHFKDIKTYSGRADCEPTGRSNFGFNIRIKDLSHLSPLDFDKLMNMKPYKEKFKDLNKVTNTLPQSVKKIVDQAVAKLVERFPGVSNDSVNVIGPTIEGVGNYPSINQDFSLQGHPNISVIGDCSGIYRGIVASMLSGYILANQNQKGDTHV